MKYTLLISTLFILFIIPVSSEQKIVFVDMDRVVSTSNAGSSIFKQLKMINDKNLVFLTNEEKKFKEEEKKLISQKNIISENDFKTNVDKLKSEINIYNQNRKKMIEEFNKLKMDSTNKLLKKINPILTKFSNENGISIILQKKDLIIGKSELDITNKIINNVNDDIKEFMIK
jgi:Skp family chaperone for outer membrane proteins